MLTSQISKVQEKEVKISSIFVWQGKGCVPWKEEAVSLTLSSELDSPSEVRPLGKAETSGDRQVHSICNRSPGKNGPEIFEAWDRESSLNIVIRDLQVVFFQRWNLSFILRQIYPWFGGNDQNVRG